MTPRLPEDVERETPPTEGDRNAATYLALIVLLGIGGGLLFLVTMVLPNALFLLLALAVVPLYFVFHYLVWGRLMSRLQPPEDE